MAASAARVVAVSVLASVAALAWPVRALTQNATLQVLYDFPYAPGHPVAGLTRGPDGALYGTAVMNPPIQLGGVFSLTPQDDGSFTYRLLHAFANGSEGALPYGGLVLASDGHLYGTTTDGGANGAGTVFRVSTNGTFTSLYSFDGASGRAPRGRLIQARDGYLYGTTLAGGLFGLGTIFRISLSGAFTRVHSFWWFDGAGPVAGLIQTADGTFYGTTLSGGSSSAGAIFRMTESGVVTPLHHFANNDGRKPAAALIQARDGNLYGTTIEGGANAGGTVFRVTTAGTFTSLHSFPAGSDTAAKPLAGLVEAADGFLYGVVSGAWRIQSYEDTHHPGALFRIGLNGGAEIIHTFDVHNGMLPLGDLIEGPGNVFYGGTVWGGAESHGSIFAFTVANGVRTIHSFRGRVNKPEGLIFGSDGNFYGVDRSSGPEFTGTIFRLAPDGTYTPLRTLRESEGTTVSPLLQASDGHLYGTTRLGGGFGAGIVFRITHAGDFTVLASFGDFDGISGMPLVQAPDGNFYGTNEYGPNNKGSIFRMTPGGTISTVYAFSDQFMSGIQAITLGRDGHLYGIAQGDGPDQLGSVFRVTTGGAFTRLHMFTGGAGGSEPVSRLVHGADGNLYGTTLRGGAANFGTVFRLSMAGELTTLHSFAGVDGGLPRSPLFEASDGFIYGTAGSAGAGFPQGSIFRIVPASGSVTTLHLFPDDNSEGAPETAGLVGGPGGALFGTTWRTGGPANQPRASFYRLTF